MSRVIGPFMLRATSDHPILELLVRSTIMSQLWCFSKNASNFKESIPLTLVLVPVFDIGEIVNSGKGISKVQFYLDNPSTSRYCNLVLGK